MIPAGNPRRNASSISTRFAESTNIPFHFPPTFFTADVYLIDSHFISLAAKAGCDTIKCQTTA